MTNMVAKGIAKDNKTKRPRKTPKKIQIEIKIHQKSIKHERPIVKEHKNQSFESFFVAN